MLHNPEFWVLVSFVVFFALFGGKLWAAIAAALDGRAEQIRAELAEAQRLRAEAETMLSEASRAKQEALVEAATVLERSRIEAAHVAEAAMAEADSSAKRRERVAIERIAAAEKAAIAEIRQVAADVATEAAREVIGQGIGEERETAILDRAIADLPRALRAA